MYLLPVKCTLYPQVQCLDCGNNLSSRDRLKEHMATQHSDNAPTFRCQCGKVFRSQRVPKSHEMLHTGGRINCELYPFEGTHGEQMRAHISGRSLMFICCVRFTQCTSGAYYPIVSMICTFIFPECASGIERLIIKFCPR